MLLTPNTIAAHEAPPTIFCAICVPNWEVRVTMSGVCVWGEGVGKGAVCSSWEKGGSVVS